MPRILIFSHSEQQSRFQSQTQTQEDRIIGYVGAMSMQIQAMTVETASGLRTQDHRLAQVEGRLQELCTDLIPRPRIRQRLQDRVMELTEGPAASSEEEQLPMLRQKDVPRRAVQEERGCICAGYQSRWNWQLPGVISFRGEAASKHLPNCPMYTTTRRTTRFGMDLDLLWLWNSHAKSITMEIVRGAGGCVISRSLMCKRIVPDDSAAFRLLDHWRFRMEEAPSVQSIRKQLNDMFRTGEALPADESADGATLTMVSFRSFALGCCLRNSWMYTSVSISQPLSSSALPSFK